MLANRDLPQWTAAFDPEVSCIGDGEMARINIEASAALARWIDLMRVDQKHFRKMVKAAVQWLPFPLSQLDGATYYKHFRALCAFNSASGRQYLMESFARDFGPEWLERVKTGILAKHTRALANGILNEHWRNSSGIEDIHAGDVALARPLTQRRLTRVQETVRRLWCCDACSIEALFRAYPTESADYLLGRRCSGRYRQEDDGWPLYGAATIISRVCFTPKPSPWSSLCPDCTSCPARGVVCALTAL